MPTDPYEAQVQVFGSDMEQTLPKIDLQTIHSLEDFGKKYKLEEDIEEKKNSNPGNGKMYLCDFSCSDHAFTKSSHLKEHKRIHTGWLPFIISTKISDYFTPFPCHYPTRQTYLFLLFEDPLPQVQKS